MKIIRCIQLLQYSVKIVPRQLAVGTTGYEGTMEFVPVICLYSTLWYMGPVAVPLNAHASIIQLLHVLYKFSGVDNTPIIYNLPPHVGRSVSNEKA